MYYLDQIRYGEFCFSKMNKSINWQGVKRKTRLALYTGFAGIPLAAFMLALFLFITPRSFIGDSYDYMGFVLIIANTAAVMATAVVLIIIDRKKISYFGFIISISIFILLFSISLIYSVFYKTHLMNALLPLALISYPLHSVIIGVTRARSLRKGYFLIPFGALLGQIIASILSLIIFFIPIVNYFTYTAIFSATLWLALSIFEEYAIARSATVV